MPFPVGTIVMERGAKMSAPKYVIGTQHLDEYGDLCYKVSKITETGAEPQGEWYAGFTEANFIPAIRNEYTQQRSKS